MSDTEAASMQGGKRSKWMTHVKRTMKANKGKSLMEVLKMAKKTYKKTGGGLSPLPLDGGRRKRRGGEEEKESESMAPESMAPESMPPSTAGRRRTRRGKKSRSGRKSRRGGMYGY